MMNNLLGILLSEIKSQIVFEQFKFPIGNDNYNIGYDSATLGKGKEKILDKDMAIHNSDYGVVTLLIEREVDIKGLTYSHRKELL